MIKKKKQKYVDNKLFLEAMLDYRSKVIEWKKSSNSGDMNTRPRVPNYIGECFLKIATHLSHKPNFINYTFRDEMICDGIENSLQYIDNFDPEKSRNPFAYFTQIIYYAFLRRIAKEKKLLYIKYKMTENANIMDEVSDRQDSDPTNSYDVIIKGSDHSTEYMNHFIKDFEQSKRRKVKHRQPSSLDRLLAEDNT
jgi:hypothetical protein